MTRKEFTVAGRASSSLLGWKAQHRIDRQTQLVAALVPGTNHHRLATKVLVLLQQSANMVAEARVMIFMARMSADRDQRG